MKHSKLITNALINYNFTSVYLQVHKKEPGKVVWIIPVALVFISVAWCPVMFKFLMEPATDQRRQTRFDGTMSTATVELSAASVNSLPQGNAVVSEKSARGKAAIITSLWKLVMIPFVAALFCKIYDRADLTKLKKGFDDFNTDHDAFPHFMAQIFTSFIGYLLGILACSMCMQRLAFALPVLLATPISIALALIQSKNVVLPFEFGKLDDPFVYAIGIPLLLAQFLSGSYYVFKEQGFIMAKESSLFWMPTYNGRNINK